jgi:hypothetical protein
LEYKNSGNPILGEIMPETERSSCELTAVGAREKSEPMSRILRNTALDIQTFDSLGLFISSSPSPSPSKDHKNEYYHDHSTPSEKHLERNTSGFAGRWLQSRDFD